MQLRNGFQRQAFTLYILRFAFALLLSPMLATFHRAHAAIINSPKGQIRNNEICTLADKSLDSSLPMGGSYMGSRADQINMVVQSLDQLHML